MPTYVDKIIVSFFRMDYDGTDYGKFELRYCPKCKLCKDKELFKSHYKNIEYNKICRRCLDIARIISIKRSFIKKTFSIKTFSKTFIYE